MEENGKTLEENASLKAKAYLSKTKNMIVMADDTGIEIDALNGEPGIHARRWKNHKTVMTDEEIINYCLERLKGVPKGKRGAIFKTVIALAIPGKVKIELFSGTLQGVISEKPSRYRKEGLPFETIFFIPKLDMFLGQVHRLPPGKNRKYLTHREKAVQKALARIKELPRFT